MLAEMSAPLLAEWLAFWRLEPWGEQRADLRAGIVAAACTAPWAGRGKAPRPADFMPDFDGSRGRRGRQTREEMVAAAKRMAGIFGAARGQYR